MKAYLLTLIALLASTASASTYVVDAAGGAGSQFTTIGAAIAASMPGDIVLVRNGTYPPFVVDRGVTVLGGSGVLVLGDVSVAGLPSTERAAVVGFMLQALNVANCQGPVILQDLLSLGGFVATTNDDVRVRSMTVQPQALAQCAGIRVIASRVEFVDTTAKGAPSTLGGPIPSAGWDGLRIQAASNVHALASLFEGSPGEQFQQQGTYAPWGGSGIGIENSNLRLVGSRAVGAPGGINWYYTDCTHDGNPGLALWGSSSTLAHSSCTWYSPPAPASQLHCWITFQPGDPANPVIPNDPMLRVVGTPAAGQTVTFEIDAPPTATVDFVFGRTCLVHDTPPSYVEELSSRERVFSLGVVPASGKIQFPFTIPSYLPKGFVLVTQVEATLPGGQLRRTNSAPVVVR